MGLAFQIQDDILNFEGTQDKFEKTIGSDAQKRKPNYMLVCAYKKLREDFFEGNILDNIASAGTIEETKKKALGLVTQVKQTLSIFLKNAFKQKLSVLIDGRVKSPV